MVFGPLMDKIDVVLQRVDITAVIERHEQHNVIGIQVEFGIGQERDLGVLWSSKSQSPLLGRGLTLSTGDGYNTSC